jgi:hypothetical protein
MVAFGMILYQVLQPNAFRGNISIISPRISGNKEEIIRFYAAIKVQGIEPFIGIIRILSFS